MGGEKREEEEGISKDRPRKGSAEQQISKVEQGVSSKALHA